MVKDSFIANYRTPHIVSNLDYDSHLEYEIYFFHAGSCRYLIHNRVYDLEPGDILLMNGLTLHKANANLQQDYIRSMVLFSPHWIKDTLQELGGIYLLDVFKGHSHFFIRSNENEESRQLEKVISQLEKVRWEAHIDEVFRETEIKVLIMSALVIIHRLAQMGCAKEPTIDTDKEEHVKNIANYIQNNYRHKLTLDIIANALNINKFYMSHLFKEITGFTIMGYVMKARLTQVKYLLEMSPDMPLHQIAYACGFESPAHFSRYFRSKVGVTPSKYREIRLKAHKNEVGH